MHYYEVFIADKSYKGNSPLTYSCIDLLKKGQVVVVPFGKSNKEALAIAWQKIEKPAFKCKSIYSDIKITIPKELISTIIWLQEYYGSSLGEAFSMILPKIANKPGVPKKSVEAQSVPTKPEKLTKEQLQAVEQIRKSKHNNFLLHGDTGSGKTRVYLELANEVMDSGRSVLVLTPEIGLSPQTHEYLSSRSKYGCLMYHSELKPTERSRVWHEIASSTRPNMIIGPRSALFLPISNLGLIVVDEFHDSSYKQQSSPNYQSSRVASVLARNHVAKMVLGSATPSISDYFTFKEKKLPIIRMSSLAINKNPSLKTIKKIVDLRERENFTISPYISNQLISAVNDALEKKQQSLIFLNRRGTARSVACEVCGWQAKCNKCDLNLVFHHDSHKLICHSCGSKYSPINICPVCSNLDISYKGIGTKAIVQELIRLFPGAELSRFDSDNTKAESLSSKKRSMEQGEIDIIVGTQIISKGLDLPNLSVVGVINADASLILPDFSSEEVTFQQINQVIGRVGRGHLDGTVIVQTYYPKSETIRAAVNNNYSLFYNQHISDRKKFNFPPFCFVMRINFVRKTSESAEANCRKLYAELSNSSLEINCSRPMPSFTQNSPSQNTWQLVIKSRKRSDLLKIINEFGGSFGFDIDPINLL